MNNDKKISNDQDVADNFNNYFINSPRLLVKNINRPDSNISSMNKVYLNSIYIEPPTEEEVLNIVVGLTVIIDIS